MPVFTACVSCGRRCRRYPDTAPGGPLCRACRARVCRTCWRPIGSTTRRGSAFCSEECADLYRVGAAS